MENDIESMLTSLREFSEEDDSQRVMSNQMKKKDSEAGDSGSVTIGGKKVEKVNINQLAREFIKKKKVVKGD